MRFKRNFTFVHLLGGNIFVAAAMREDAVWWKLVAFLALTHIIAELTTTPAKEPSNDPSH